MTPCEFLRGCGYENICTVVVKQLYAMSEGAGRGGIGTTFADGLHAPFARALRVRPDPNNDSPLNTDAAQLWADQEKYREVCLQKYRDGGGKV